MMQTERAKYWKEQVENWQSSGVKMRAWCKANEISEKSLSRWKKKLADEEGVNQKKQKAPNGWCEVKTTPAKQILPSGIKLEINEQIRIELNHGFDHTLLREVVEALSR